MGGWIDGLTDGWVDGSAAGWVDQWVGGWIAGFFLWVDGQLDWYVDGRAGRQGCLGGHMVGHTTNGHIEGHGHMQGRRPGDV